MFFTWQMIACVAIFIFLVFSDGFGVISRPEAQPGTGTSCVTTMLTIACWSTTFWANLNGFLDISNARPQGIRSGLSSSQMLYQVLTSPQLLQILLQLLHWMPCLGHGRHPYASTRCFITNHRERLGKVYHSSHRGCLDPFLPLLHLVHLVPSQGPPDRRKGSSRCRLQHQ